MPGKLKLRFTPLVWSVKERCKMDTYPGGASFSELANTVCVQIGKSCWIGHHASNLILPCSSLRPLLNQSPGCRRLCGPRQCALTASLAISTVPKCVCVFVTETERLWPPQLKSQPLCLAVPSCAFATLDDIHSCRQLGLLCGGYTEMLLFLFFF